MLASELHFMFSDLIAPVAMVLTLQVLFKLSSTGSALYLVSFLVMLHCRGAA